MGTKRPFLQLRHSARLAAALWLVLAFVVWNAVFDRILVLAGRRYSHAAALAVREGKSYLRIDDWMRPAVSHGVRVATLSALGIAAFGALAIAIAVRLDKRKSRADLPPPLEATEEHHRLGGGG